MESGFVKPPCAAKALLPWGKGTRAPANFNTRYKARVLPHFAPLRQNVHPGKVYGRSGLRTVRRYVSPQVRVDSLLVTLLATCGLMHHLCELYELLPSLPLDSRMAVRGISRSSANALLRLR